MSKIFLPLLAAALVSVLFSLSAFAGENRFLGTIASPDGGSFSNYTTATQFALPTGTKVTMYCDAAARILTDSMTTATSGVNKGLPIAATTLFPTSIGRTVTQIPTTDGGPSAPTGVIAIIPVSGTANCDVWQRLGTE